MNNNLETQNFYTLDNLSTTENSEGGLNLNEIKNIIQRKLFLITGCTLLMTGLAYLKISISPPIYFATFELLEPLNIETKVTSANEESRETREEITSVELNDVQLKILKSPQIVSRAVESLENKYPELNYQELINGLTINIVTDSRESEDNQDILLVTYENSDKQKVSDVIEVLTKTYIDYSAEKRLSGVKRGIAFLDQQIPQASSEVKNIEEQIKILRSKNNFIKPDISLEPLTIRSKNLSQEQNQVANQLPELKLMAKNLDRELKTQPTKSETAVKLATPQYLELLNKLRQIDIEIARKSAIFLDSSVEIQTLKQEKQQIAFLMVEAGAEIRRKLDSEIKNSEIWQQNITAETANLKSQLARWSAVSSDYNNLLQQLTVANNKLNEFILQKDTLLIEAAQQEAPWQLLTPATEPQTKNIGTINYMSLGFSLGLLVGTGIALILDKYQNIIYTTAKVKEITNLPILGTIPYIPKDKTLSFIRQTNLKQESTQKQLSSQEFQLQKQSLLKSASFSIEEFRSFAANLGLLKFNTNPDTINSDNNIKSIVITSAIHREGKSTVAFNLARACASMGQKTLLVDTDLRSDDRLTKYLGLELEMGLTNILNQNSHNLRLDNIAIKPLPLENNLSILTSGFDRELTELLMNNDTIKPDYSRLLASPKMNLLMEELEANFDLVIYDLSAIIGFADVNLLADKTDGIVVVNGLGKIQTRALTEALNQLRMCKAPILGLAINKVVSESIPLFN